MSSAEIQILMWWMVLVGSVALAVWAMFFLREASERTPRAWVLRGTAIMAFASSFELFKGALQNPAREAIGYLIVIGIVGVLLMNYRDVAAARSHRQG